MAKKQATAPAVTPAPAFGFVVDLRDGNGAPMQRKVTLSAVMSADDARKALTGALGEVKASEGRAKAAVWDAYRKAADLYSSIRAAGGTDADATAEVRKVVEAAGLEGRNTGYRYARAARAMAAGLTPEAGDNPKEWADENGHSPARAREAGPRADALKKAAAKAAKAAGDLCADLLECGPAAAALHAKAVALHKEVKAHAEAADAAYTAGKEAAKASKKKAK